jgi:predicted  nucleic acid-binding Zn-ribbon protein
MPPQYDDATLERLLELQAEDTAIVRLDERKAALPEAKRLSEINEQLAELAADIEIATKQDDEISREQARLEGEIQSVGEKIGREEERMFSGKIANPKELSALQAEVESLKRKRGGVEDQLLEVMVQKDDASGTLGSLSAEHGAASSEASDLSSAVAKLTTEIDAELGEHLTKREEIAAQIPAELLSQYDKLRAQKHGVGVAALEGGTCSGCHTKLSNVEVERLRAERGLQRCDNCRRILVIR